MREEHRPTSSMISALAYEDGDLEVTFRDGKTYRYSGVPRETWDGLKGAASAGQYFHRQIKGRHVGVPV